MANKYKILLIMLLISKLAFAANKGAYVVIQNASLQAMHLNIKDTSCIKGAEKLKNITLHANQVQRFYLETQGDSHHISCKFKTSKGKLVIKNSNGNSEILEYKISAPDGSNIGTQDDGHAIDGIYIRAKSINTAKDGQDILLINIMPDNTNHSSNWMGDYQLKISNLALNQLIIPGTHDSFTNDMGSELCAADTNASTIAKLPHFGINFVKAQDLSFDEQLNRGIRYFDARLCLQNNQVYTTHALISKANFFSQVAALNNYLTLHPNELVILDLNHAYGFDDTSFANFLNQLYTTYAAHIAPYDNVTPTSKISDFWHNNYQLIVIAPKAYNDLISKPEFKWVWPHASINSPWKSNIYNNYAAIIDFVSQNLANKGTTNLLVSQLQFTPDSDYITSHPFTSLEYLAYLNLSAMNNWLVHNYSQGLNIYIRDFSLGFDGVSLVDSWQNLSH